MRKPLAFLLLPLLAAAAPDAWRLFGKKQSEERNIEHALSRLTYGPRPGDAASEEKMGLKKWIERQLHPERIPENPQLLAKLKPLETLEMSTRDILARYPPRRVPAGARRRNADRPNLAGLLEPDQMRALRSGSPEERARALSEIPEDKVDDLMQALPPAARRGLMASAPAGLQRKMLASAAPPQAVAYDLGAAKILRAVYSDRQLEELLVDFWYNHFNVFLDKGADRFLVTAYEREAIRPHVLGKFGDMLRATAKDPAMLFYLDNWQSVAPQQAPVRRRANAPRRGLNENYARELLELHTLGVDGGYTQKDIVEVARCFTGWTIRQPLRDGSFEFNERLHDKGEKTVLGVKIPAGGGMEDGLKTLEILARHPSTARFISRKLAQRFVADDPPPALVERMAKTFRSKDGDLRAVMKTMLESKEFWSEGAYRAKLKTPLEMMASAIRASGAELESPLALAAQLQQLGQPLYRKTEPTGYSTLGSDWINSAALLARMNFALALAGNRIPGVKVDSARLEAARGVLPSSAVAGETDPVKIAGLLMGGPEFQKR